MQIHDEEWQDAQWRRAPGECRRDCPGLDATNERRIAARRHLHEMQPGKVSIMPEGLEKQLTARAFGLLAFSRHAVNHGPASLGRAANAVNFIFQELLAAIVIDGHDPADAEDVGTGS